MERQAHKARSFAEAEEWDRQQMWALTPDERFEIARVLRERVYGSAAPDVREAERLRRAKQDAGRPKDLDDLDHLPKA